MEHLIYHETQNLRITPLFSKESEYYRLLRNREDNRSFFLNSGFISQEQQESWYSKYIESPDYMFSIYHKNVPAVFIGGAGIYNIDPSKRDAEFGRIIIDRYIVGGRGYGLEALLAICEIAREQLGLESLFLEVLPDNVPAIKTYERAGFIREDRSNPDLIFMRKNLRA